MAEKLEPKPFFPLKRQFVESLDRFVHEAGLLANAVRAAIQVQEVNEAGAKILQQQLDAFHKVRFGEEE
jgi:hypothetical protein